MDAESHLMEKDIVLRRFFDNKKKICESLQKEYKQIDPLYENFAAKSKTEITLSKGPIPPSDIEYDLDAYESIFQQYGDMETKLGITKLLMNNKLRPMRFDSMLPYKTKRPWIVPWVIQQGVDQIAPYLAMGKPAKTSNQ